MDKINSELSDLFNNIDETDFEHLIAEIWEQQGWTTELTPESRDRGIDIIANREDPYPEKQVIQAKCYSKGNNIGSPEIQQYASLRLQVSNVDTVIVVTTSEFTKEATELANDLNVKLIDRKSLAQLIQDNDTEDLLEMNIPEVDRNYGASWGSIEQELVEEYNWLSHQPGYGWVAIELNMDYKGDNSFYIKYAYDDFSTADYETKRLGVERQFALDDEVDIVDSSEAQLRRFLEDNGFGETLGAGLLFANEDGSDKDDNIARDADITIGLINEVFSLQPSDIIDIDSFVWTEYPEK